MKALFTILLLLLFSCSKDYSCEGCFIGIINQPSQANTLKYQSGALNDLPCPITWAVYDSTDTFYGSVQQDAYALGDVSLLFVYSYLKVTAADTITAFKVQCYKRYPAERPDDLITEKTCVLNDSIPFDKNATLIRFCK